MVVATVTLPSGGPVSRSCIPKPPSPDGGGLENEVSPEGTVPSVIFPLSTTGGPSVNPEPDFVLEQARPESAKAARAREGRMTTRRI